MWWLTAVAIAATPPLVHVDRHGRMLYVLNDRGAVVHQEPIGIGRGGLGEKTSMSDFITPVGTFTVDLILDETGTYNAIAPSLRARWAGDPTYGALVAPRSGLATLYANMASLDFNGDDVPDRAYGVAYIGLDSASAVTGPKMRLFRGTPYWYSIALHGTPSPEGLGQARSGGCVHVSKDLLRHLLHEGILSVGQTVRIADGPPTLR